MLTVKEVADRLKVSRSCVYQLIESGRLAHHRIGLGRGAIRVSENDLTAFLESNREAPTGDAPKLKTPRPRLRHIRI